SQLERFLGLLEKVKLGPFRPVVRKGEHGDAMFLVLGGEARVVDKIDGKDQTLQTLEVGNFFGEISLFDQGPRTADVVTNKDSTFLKISKAALQRLLAEQPDVAAAFLMALVRLMGGRLRAANKSFAESLTFKNAEGQIRSPSSSSSPNWGGRK
ncbi:MAG: cyclic nucleotide-binding domain-containing protein, partial [Verrucomicrobiae bacterium]|nr:cyclic nucleotide-binding domain-containing protein [Verrucomicrobiae bacterium]